MCFGCFQHSIVKCVVAIVNEICFSARCDLAVLNEIWFNARCVSDIGV